MTEEFARNQIKNLRSYLALLKTQYQEFKEKFGKEWIERKVHEILDDIQYYQDFLDDLED